MIIQVVKPSQPIRVVLQRGGYAWFHDPRSGDESYVRRLGRGFYPRFHMYVQESADSIRLNLHLDQKQPSYDGTSKHAGEYDGDVVVTEGERIRALFPSQ